ncbi:MAG: hypothetical protein JSV25_06135 [Spirochaetota bacterium]|nr:MAG: hypothetical protein JSV25_06135 [Spirochaetota bacterium]
MGIIVFRAFISGVLFSGLVYAGLYLLKIYVPEIVTANQKVSDQKTSEDTGRSSFEYAVEDENKISQHIKVGEHDEVMDKVESEKEMEGGGAPITPEAEEGTGEEGLPSLDRLFEEEETVPDLEIAKEVKKEDKRIIGDYINVGNVRIPNEPEVIAKAIKKVMSTDER